MPRKKMDLTKVTAQFHTADIRHLQDQALTLGVPWHFLLREAVHRGIQKKEIR